jgi:glycosyltransferase involved in cell wall biosynthesis
MTSKTPRLSLGLPVYNGGRYLAECLDAVVAQDLRDFELIISDNASTDNTGAIAEEYARHDSRIRVVRQPVNLGAAPNFNYVFHQAKAPYFKWVCADDGTAPGFLSAGVAELEAHPETVLVYGDVTLIDERGKKIGEHVQNLDLRSSDTVERFLTARNYRGLLNVLQGIMRTDALRGSGLMGSFPGSDEALMVELSLHGTFHAINQPMLFRRMHAEAASAGQTLEDRQQHLAPKSVKKIHMDGWRRSTEHLRFAMRAPLSLGLRTRVLGIVLRSMAVNWKFLYWELTDAARRVLRKPFTAQTH